MAHLPPLSYSCISVLCLDVLSCFLISPELLNIPLWFLLPLFHFFLMFLCFLLAPSHSKALCRGTTSSAMTPFIWDIDLGALLEAEGEDANDSRGSSALKFSTGIRTRILSLSPFVL